MKTFHAVAGCAFLFAAACSGGGAKTSPLVAAPDALSATRVGTSRTTDVTANDTTGGEILGITSWSDGLQGIVTYEGDGVFAYDPDPGTPPGTDAFTYSLVDDLGRESTGTVSVTIAPGWGEPSSLFADFTSLRTITVEGRPMLFLAGDADLLTGAFSLWSTRVGADGQWTSPERVDGGTDRLFFSFSGSTIFLATTNGVDVSVVWCSINLASEFEMHGTVFDGAWVAPQILFSGSTQPAALSVAMDAAGNASAVWRQDGELRGARRSSTTWGPATIIDSQSDPFPSPRAVVANGNGTFSDCWLQQDDGSGNQRLWCSRGQTGGVWSAAQAVEPDTGASYGSILLAPTGGLGGTTLVFRYGFQLFSSQMNATTGVWSALTLVDGSFNTSFNTMRLTSDAAGNATLFWLGDDLVSGEPQVWTARLIAGVWTANAPVDPNPEAAGLVVAYSDPAGWSVARWIDATGAEFASWTSPSGGVGPAATLKAAGEPVTVSTVVQRAGEVDVFLRRTDAANTTLSVINVDGDGTFSPPIQIWSEAASLVFTPGAFFDAQGDLWAYWTLQEEGQRRVVAARRNDATRVWDSAQSAYTGTLFDVSAVYTSAGTPFIVLDRKEDGLNSNLFVLDRR